MSDLVPSREGMQRIRLCALCLCKACRHYDDTINLLHQIKAERDLVVKRAAAQSEDALSLTLWKEGAEHPYGWPDGTEHVLSILIGITRGRPFPPIPGGFPALEQMVQEHLCSEERAGDLTVNLPSKTTDPAEADPVICSQTHWRISWAEVETQPAWRMCFRRKAS